MGLFNRRTNYLPEGEIYKDSRTGKYFFKCEDYVTRYLVFKNERYLITFGEGMHLFNTVEEILQVLYVFACDRHVDEIHKSITFNKGIAV